MTLNIFLLVMFFMFISFKDLGKENKNWRKFWQRFKSSPKFKYSLSFVEITEEQKKIVIEWQKKR